MSRYLTPFSSINDLTPLFEQGGQLVFVELIVHSGYVIHDSKDRPWKIILRSLTSRGLDYQKEILIHEFMHLFHWFSNGYQLVPKEHKFFHEVDTDRATKKLIKRNPEIADQITKELIRRPNCSIVFKSDEARNTPFWNYYQSLC